VKLLPSAKEARYTLARYLRKAAARVAPKISESGILFPGLGSDQLPTTAKRALIIYNVGGIERYVRGVSHDDPFYNKHTVYWEAVQMVKLLNQQGYIVDYHDERLPTPANLASYDLVIDHGNNLQHCPVGTNQKKVYWATNNHWLVWNAGELERIQWFKDRTGFVIPMNRQLPNNNSDEYADYLTYFGTKLQADSYSPKSEKYVIDISSCFVPPYQKKDLSKARNKFLWIAGGGSLHKGLNLAIEAFCKMPDAELYVIADMHDPNEPQFYEWAGPLLAKHPNIHEMGWYDLTSPDFDALADQCIGVLYLSSSCGGPGSTARVLHNGLIPVVTPTGFVRAEHLGYVVQSETADQIIEGVVASVRDIMAMPESQLQEKSDAVRAFGKQHHTREAFSKSFTNLIERL
jgi:hypothetical protein